MERVLIVALCVVALANLAVAWWWKREADRWRLARSDDAAPPRARPKTPGQTDLFPDLQGGELHERTTKVIRKLLGLGTGPAAKLTRRE